MIVLGALGLTLWLGWPSGPHCASLTLPAAGLAWALVAGGWRLGGSLPKRRARNDHRRSSRRHLADALMVVCEGARATRQVVAGGNWKLVGAIGYYACDNAVLWTAFRAVGHAPAPSVIVMGYLVGSLGMALPVPAGVGAAEGGLIGALVLYGAPAGPAAGAVLLYRGISLFAPVGIRGHRVDCRSRDETAASPRASIWRRWGDSCSGCRGGSAPASSSGRAAPSGAVLL